MDACKCLLLMLLKLYVITRKFLIEITLATLAGCYLLTIQICFLAMLISCWLVMGINSQKMNIFHSVTINV